MLLTPCYVPCVPSSEEERKHGSREQGSLTLHTSLVHVEKSGTHQLRWEEGEKDNIYKLATGRGLEQHHVNKYMLVRQQREAK